jgi:beta-glucanase (GH16 family)
MEAKMSLLINEEFNPWSGNISPDGIWQKAGVWYGTGGNELDPARAVLTPAYPGESSTGFLNLTITPSTNPLEGAEIQSLTGYGYGYYEVRMMPSDVSGGVASFFLIGAPDYSYPEFDIEFLLNSHNQVTFSNHPGADTTYYNLSFDPTAGFHTYGILWTPGPDPGVATVAVTVDGVIVHSETSAAFVLPPNGVFIMMNTWSGNADFGGGPPTQNSTSVYDWVHFTPWDGGPPPPPAGTVSIDDVTISEGNSGTKVATFTVTRSSGTAAFDVNFATSDGTATVADSD